MNENQSTNGNKDYIINHSVEEPPELISEQAIENIKFVLERTEPLSDDDLDELGREYHE